MRLNLWFHFSEYPRLGLRVFNEIAAVMFPPDAVHAVVQQAGKAAVTEMVRASVRQGKEEDLQRLSPDHPGQEAQDVQLPGVEGPQDCLQEVCGERRFQCPITFTHTRMHMVIYNNKHGEEVVLPFKHFFI